MYKFVEQWNVLLSKYNNQTVSMYSFMFAFLVLFLCTYFIQNLVSITDNVYNPSNQAAYTTLDGRGEVSHWVNHLI